MTTEYELRGHQGLTMELRRPKVHTIDVTQHHILGLRS